MKLLITVLLTSLTMTALANDCSITVKEKVKVVTNGFSTEYATISSDVYDAIRKRGYSVTSYYGTNELELSSSCSVLFMGSSCKSTAKITRNGKTIEEKSATATGYGTRPIELVAAIEKLKICE